MARARDIDSDDRTLLMESLREVLRAPSTSGKALEAKASAARQLALLSGVQAPGAEARVEPEKVAADPMFDLDDEVGARRRRRATGAR